MFKRVWQVFETIFFASKITFFVETCENFEFFIFFRILLVQVVENYTKNNDSSMAGRSTAYNSAYNALLHVTQIFFRTSNISEIISKTVFG